jgi:hypothetical protein
MRYMIVKLDEVEGAVDAVEVGFLGWFTDLSQALKALEHLKEQNPSSSAKLALMMVLA